MDDIEIAAALAASKFVDGALPPTDPTYEVIADWWREQSRGEIESVVPKAMEYGATDLLWIGRTIGLMLGRPAMSDEEATETGIFFYTLGKIARWMAAIHEGRRASDDTLHDAAIYIKMAQRTRTVGGWPFAMEEGEGS